MWVGRCLDFGFREEGTKFLMRGGGEARMVLTSRRMIWRIWFIVMVGVAVVEGYQFEAKLGDGVRLETVMRRGEMEMHPNGDGKWIVSGERLDVLSSLESEGVLTEVQRRKDKVCGDLWKQTSSSSGREDFQSKSADDNVHVAYVTTSGPMETLGMRIGNLSIEHGFDASSGYVSVKRRDLADLLRILEDSDQVLWGAERLPMRLLNNYASVTVQTGRPGKPSKDNAAVWAQGVTGVNTVIGKS